MDYIATTPDTFSVHYENARTALPRIRDATSPWSELQAHHANASWYVAPDHCSGFGVDLDGTLLGVWSLVPGRGPDLLKSAVWRGATQLWCFEGYLTGFYARVGFAEVSREPNWTPGGPDVVHMALPAAQASA